MQVDTLVEADDTEETEPYVEPPLTPFSSMSDTEAHVNDTTQESTSASTPQTSGASSSNRSRSQQNTVKRPKTKNANAQKRQALLDLAHNALSCNVTEPEEEYQIVGKRLGYQLKGMAERQRTIAEKLISDVMFYAKMGKLTEDSAIHIPTYSRSHPISSVATNSNQAQCYVSYPPRTTQEQCSTYSILPLEVTQRQQSESSLPIGEFLHTYQPQDY